MKSELCLYDVEQASVRVILSTDMHIEAPNWTPDGAALIVNGRGRLFHVALAAPSLELMDTGFAVRLNNDHGISPDGKTLFLSDKCETDGESTIYRLPIEGGIPHRLTPVTPSYWHGISPVGAEITYVGKRDGAFDIFVMSSEGGPETCLTNGFDHCDGPDYSADGQWIWFNGERDGTVELWRVRRDGSNIQKMTEDDRINWFPHPSPDGEKVLYLSYPKGTLGHPGGLDVTLCMMPQDGGPTETIVELWGGQGSINVPCWAPDSQQFAFMRYQK